MAVNGLDASESGTWSELTGEALYLARLAERLQPDSAEASGLLALMLHCEARRSTQFDAAGRFVPLTQQDTSQWNTALIREAEAMLWRASQLRQPGHFQIEAAIQSAHSQRAFTGQTPWKAIASLYAALVEHFPSIGARIGGAVAMAEAGDDAGGLRVLASIAPEDVSGHQPYWTALAYLRGRAGHGAEARQALDRAIGLTADGRIRAYLQRVRETSTWTS